MINETKKILILKYKKLVLKMLKYYERFIILLRMAEENKEIESFMKFYNISTYEDYRKILNDNYFESDEHFINFLELYHSLESNYSTKSKPQNEKKEKERIYHSDFKLPNFEYDYDVIEDEKDYWNGKSIHEENENDDWNWYDS